TCHAIHGNALEERLEAFLYGGGLIGRHGLATTDKSTKYGCRRAHSTEKELGKHDRSFDCPLSEIGCTLNEQALGKRNTVDERHAGIAQPGGRRGGYVEQM